MPTRSLLLARMSGLVLLSCAFAHSAAASSLKVSGGIDVHGTGAYLSQDERSVAAGGWPIISNDEWQGALEGTLFLKARTTLENGLEIGGHLGIDFNFSGLDETASASGGFGAVSPTFRYDDTLWFNEGYFYLVSAFGKGMIGKVRGAASLQNLGTPHILGSNRADIARTYLVEDPATPGHVFMPNGLSLRTDLHASGTSPKLVYVTPRLIGLQLALSYTPEAEDNYDGILTVASGAPAKQQDIWEIGASYYVTLSELDLGIYAGYIAGSRDTVPPPFAAFQTDLEEWGGGAALKFEGFTLGANYRNTNIAGGGGLGASFKQPVGIVLKDRRTELWSVGASYETGPWKFGIEYVEGDEELLIAGQRQEGSGLQLAVSYTILDGLSVSAGYQNWDYNAAGTLPVITPNSPSAVAFTPNTADSDIVFFGITYNVTQSDLFRSK